MAVNKQHSLWLPLCHLIRRSTGGGHGCFARFDGSGGGDDWGFGSGSGGSVGDVATGDEVDAAGNGVAAGSSSNAVGARDGTVGPSLRRAAVMTGRAAFVNRLVKLARRPRQDRAGTDGSSE